MQTHLSFATQLARQAGELVLPYFRKSGLETRLKTDRSVVTEADLAADRWIAEQIHKQYPDDILLSEELQNISPPSIQGRDIWIIDPIDGTTNFSLGLPFWGILVTHLAEGWPQETALYFPAIEELFTAQIEGGAFLNGAPLQVMPPNPDQPVAFFSCCSRTYRRYNVSVPYKARILGCASYSFCAVARGMAVVCFESTPKIWDIAGAWLLLHEAGGSLETYDNRRLFPIVPEQDYAKQIYPTLAAATPELLSRARQQIQPKETRIS